MSEQVLASQLEALKLKIPYDEDIFESEEKWEAILIDLLKDSCSILLETLYPFDDFENYAIPKRYYNWQLRCCVELYNLADKQGITNYTENTISWTKLSDGLSNTLMNKLTSNVGIPKSSDREEVRPSGTWNLIYQEQSENEGA